MVRERYLAYCSVLTTPVSSSTATSGFIMNEAPMVEAEYSRMAITATMNIQRQFL